VIKLLVVDDSALVRKLLGKVFAAEPEFSVAFARTGIEALEQLKTLRPDVITLDVHMPEMSGLACLDRIMVEHPCPVVMVSSVTEEGADATLEALRLGAVDFVQKPIGPVSLHIHDWAPILISRVKIAAGTKLNSTLRLRERVRHRIDGTQVRVPRRRAKLSDLSFAAATGEGLVVIGASTGGPPALELLLTSLPGTFSWPILIAQHMPASFTGSLARRLDAICQLSIKEVFEATPLVPGTAYIGRGDADLIVSRRAGGLVAMSAPLQQDYPWHPSTNRLVRSALEHFEPSQLIGVLLTGMGNDGAEAMAILSGSGGKAIAESEETAIVWGMPGALVKIGGATSVLPLQDIAAQLVRMVP
jgi:two-component system chemotaxis response regulator CheB